MKHCEGGAFIFLRSIKSDPLDACGEESELEIEVPARVTPHSHPILYPHLPPPPPPETKVVMQKGEREREREKRTRHRKKIFEKLPRVPCHTASCVDWAVLFVIYRHEYWVDVKGGGGDQGQEGGKGETRICLHMVESKLKMTYIFLLLYLYANSLLCHHHMHDITLQPWYYLVFVFWMVSSWECSREFSPLNPWNCLNINF